MKKSCRRAHLYHLFSKLQAGDLNDNLLFDKRLEKHYYSFPDVYMSNKHFSPPC